MSITTGMRTTFVLYHLLLVMAAVQLQSCESPDTETEKPNVVIILIDDYGYADISLEGNTQIETPNIDQIGREGIQFTNFYQSSAACAPTRASLLTGKYHLRTGVWGVHWGRDFVSTEERTFADLAQEVGYTTGAFGKWHSGKSAGYHTWNRGFDTGLESNLYNYFNTNVLYNNKLVNVEGPITKVITDNAIKFIEENKDDPFLCYIPYQSIHEPFNCPENLFKKYKEQGYSNHVARLYGMIEELDDNIGRLTDRITELGLDDNTLIMFMVDDGSSPGFDLTYNTRRMNDQEKKERTRGWKKELKGTKANIWEGGVKSPCYMRWKGKLEPGRKVEAISGVIDVLPTLADICGFKSQIDQLSIDGQTLFPSMMGDTTWLQDRFYFDNTNLYQIPMDRLNMDEPEIREMSVRHKNYKLVRLNYALYGDEEVKYLLFDLYNDEKEEHNLIAELPQVAKMLQDTLSGWYKDVSGSKNAFTISTFQIGDWNERATFVNADAISAKSGTIKRDEGPGFEWTNWDTPGNSLSYNINVLEEGDYAVELWIEANEQDLGGTLEISTQNASTTLTIDDTEKIKSDVLHLPKGPQTLSIELKSTGDSKKAMDWLKNILVHRVPEATDSAIIRNPGLIVELPSSNKRISSQISHAPFDFCNNSGIYGTTLEAVVGEKIDLTFMVDNPEQIQKMELFVNFDKMFEADGYEPKHELRLDQPGLYTINVEYSGASGFRCSSQANVRIVDAGSE